MEVEEAMKYMIKARELFMTANMIVTNELTMDHQDGEKLLKILKFVKDEFANKFVRNFGRSLQVPGEVGAMSLNHFDKCYLKQGTTELKLLDSAGLSEAEKVLSDVRSDQRNALLFILDTVRPVLPTYRLSIIFMILAKAFEAPLWAHSLPSYQNSIATINLNATQGDFGFGPEVIKSAQGHAILFIVGFLFSRPIELLGTNLSDRAAQEFSGPLRQPVMGAIMKQDTEYFDFNTSAALQERLNRDTNELVENMLALPRRIMEYIFRVIQRTATLYFVAPSMLWACLYFNVPFFVVTTFLTGRLLRRLYGQRDRSSESTVADTLELLQNIRTVRQFSMMKEEKDNYTFGNASRNVFESRIRTIESVVRNIRLVVHVVGRMYIICIALLLAVEGKTSVENAVVASTVGMWLQHDMKNLLEQVPSLVKVMKPVHRVSLLLACIPRIEQDPAHLNTALLRPEQFKGPY
mmetsp:Transcript_41798/g.50120  ORF Transcript_41798/g.50120 Transcript_41798/m.50120 type:complete len:465 (-) Transcript_41798:1135-2529(-)